MIEGLKVTIATDELVELCLKQADHHRERAQAYGEQFRNLKDVSAEYSRLSHGDARTQMHEKQQEHDGKERELRFIAAHVKADEEYLLGEGDLRQIDVLRGRW